MKKQKQKGGRVTGTRNWTKEEIQYLKENWGYSTVRTMATHLNRTRIALIVKSKRVGLKSCYKSGDYLTANGVAKLLKVDIHAVTDYWIKKCGLKCTKKVMRLKKKMCLVEYEDLMKWLSRNQDKWDSRKIKKYGLGYEPEWLRQKRILDSYEPARKNKKWTKAEDSLVMLFLEEGKKYEEIAERMNRSASAVEHRLLRITTKHLRKVVRAKRKQLVKVA